MNPAFAHTKQQLLQPFGFAQWARLAFVGLLAGEMSSGGGCNTNINLPSWPGRSPASPHIHTAFLPAQWTSHPVLVVGSVAILIVVVLALLVLLTYVSSVMRFILFDSVIAKECHIRQGWTRRQRPGLRLFVWQILFMLVTWAALVIVMGFPAACAWALGWFAHARDHVLELVLVGLTVFLVLFVLFVIAAVVHVMTKDFVVPQMALEDISTVEGWRRLWLSLKSDRAGYAGYVGMKIVLAIGAAILLGIVTAIAILILLIPIGGAGIIAVLGGKAAGWTWNLHTIALAVIFGCVALAIFTFVAALISVPVVVFFPAYSIYFFAPRYPPLASLLWPQPPAPTAPPG
jgi:hypothetical protein